MSDIKSAWFRLPQVSFAEHFFKGRTSIEFPNDSEVMNQGLPTKVRLAATNLIQIYHLKPTTITHWPHLPYHYQRARLL